MNEAWATLLTGLLTLVGVIITTTGSVHKIENKLELNQAVINTKIEGGGLHS